MSAGIQEALIHSSILSYWVACVQDSRQHVSSVSSLSNDLGYLTKNIIGCSGDFLPFYFILIYYYKDFVPGT